MVYINLYIFKMTIEDIQITFVGMKPTQALKNYIVEKVDKYEHLWSEATGIEVVLKEYVTRRGVKDDFRVDINVKLPRSIVRVEENGENMYAIIDTATDTLARRLKRYQGKKEYWEGVTPWKVLEADAHLESVENQSPNDQYSDYTPTIATRKRIDDMTPLEEGEAIEKMELLGYDQFLFRNKSTGKISMLYRRFKGGYGLVEPSDSGV